MSINARSAGHFVQQAALPPMQRTRHAGVAAAASPAAGFDASKPEAWVVGPQIFNFVDGVSVERRTAITQSSLFASLVANAAQGTEQTEAWFDAYAEALTQLGWTVEEQFARSYDQTGTTADVHQAVLDFAAVLGVGGSALVLVTAALDAMKQVSENRPWITLFDRQTQAQKLKGFQIGLVDQAADGRFQVKLMSFTMNLAQADTQVLFVRFSTFDVALRSAGRVVTINEAVLSAVTPQLVQRLQDYSASFIAKVALPPLPLPPR